MHGYNIKIRQVENKKADHEILCNMMDSEQELRQGNYCVNSHCPVFEKAGKLDRHFDIGMQWPYCSQKTF